MREEFAVSARRLVEIGNRFDAMGWVLGTSGNFCIELVRVPRRLAITASGIPKGELTPSQILEIDGNCAVVQRTAVVRPSAEARLHVAIARVKSAGAILHTHSIWSTVLSERYASTHGLMIEGYEMLKGLEGVTTHKHREWIPIIENDQDTSRLAEKVRGILLRYPAAHAFLLRRHGLYTWGETVAQAVRHVEIVEFLLEAVARSEAASWQP